MTASTPVPPGPLVFRCITCGAYACFGYDCDLLAAPPRLGRWYCREHRPGHTPPPALQPGPAPKPEKQGNLL